MVKKRHSQKPPAGKGVTMCRSKRAGKVQTEGMRRQRDKGGNGATQNQKCPGGTELALNTEVRTVLPATCYVQC